jgi:hypothetical protein
MIDYSKLRATTDYNLHGMTVKVSAAPFGLVRKLIRADGSADQADASADMVRACCTVDSDPLDPDQLTAIDIAALAKAAMDVNEANASDFPTPPVASDSGG